MHHYVNCGLDYVWLLSGFDYVATPQGRGVRIHDLDGLQRAIADRVINAPMRLRGQEVRFLRSMLDMTQESLARALGQTRASVARWEGARDKPIPGASDRALRLYYAAQTADGPAVRRLADLLRDMYEIRHGEWEERFADRHGWRPAA